jgi:DNA repair protein RAD50
LNELKRQLKDLASMKQHAIHIAKTQKEADRLREEISNLETELSATGSTKTADEVHVVLDVLASDMYDFPYVSPNSLR